MDANSISKLRPEIENLARNRGQELDFETKSEIEFLASISGKNLDFGFLDFGAKSKIEISRSQRV